jgi:hypothetical protein
VGESSEKNCVFKIKIIEINHETPNAKIMKNHIFGVFYQIHLVRIITSDLCARGYLARGYLALVCT